MTDPPPPPPYKSPPNLYTGQTISIDLLTQLLGDGAVLGGAAADLQHDSRFTESFKTAEYLHQCEDGGVIPLNALTRHQLEKDKIRERIRNATSVQEIEEIKRAAQASSQVPDAKWPAGVILQVITRLLPFSSKYRQLIPVLPMDSKLSVNIALNAYRDLLVDFSHPYKTIPIKELTRDYLENSREYTGVTIDPFPDAMTDFKIAIGGACPYQTVGANVVPYDINATILENLWRQNIGTDKYLFIGGTGMYNAAYDIQPFAFKEYIKHKIPLKRCTNGASLCYVDPASGTYYITMLSLANYHFRILKNLIIYENVTGRTPYIQTGIKYLLSMVEDAEDLKLLMDYGIIRYPNRMNAWERFTEQMAELQSVMSEWVLSRTQSFHLEMVKIAMHKEAMGDTTSFTDYAKLQYTNGVLGTHITADKLYKDASKV